MSLRCFLSFVLLAWAGVALADFVPDDQIVSDPGSDLPQPEFDRATNRIVWETGRTGCGSVTWIRAPAPSTRSTAEVRSSIQASRPRFR